MDDQVSHPYSKFSSFKTQPEVQSDSEVAASFIFDFEKAVGDADDEKEVYQLLIRLVDDGLNLIHFDVNMKGIPESDKQGQEVIAKWRLLHPDFVSDETFYTDSNGLEMQKRVLNYRETFDLDTDSKVSANYYPINSAIAVKSSADSGPHI